MGFWLFILPLPLFLFWSPPHFGCPRLPTNEQTSPIELPATSPSSRLLSLCNTTNGLPKPINPTSGFAHFFPTRQCFTKHYDPLHSITLYLPISAPFLPPPPSSDPFPTLGAGLSPAPRFYFAHLPGLPDSKKEDSFDIFDIVSGYATRTTASS